MTLCTKCNKEFKNKYNLTKHLNKKIPCNNVIKCDNCLTIFKTNQILSNHLNRKYKCIKVDLEKEIQELKHKNEILEIESKYKDKIIELKDKQNITNITNNDNSNNNTFILNNFGNENLNFIKKKTLKEDIKSIINNNLPVNIEWRTKLKVDNLEYQGFDIKQIDIFRLFIKLIFKNDKYPENKTIKYDEEEDNFYYYSNKEWCVFEEKSKNCLMGKVVEKIQKLLLDKKPITDEQELHKLEMYLGEEYNIKINKIDQTDYGILSNTVKDKERYKKVLTIEYKYNDAFENHEKNKII